MCTDTVTFAYDSERETISVTFVTKAMCKRWGIQVFAQGAGLRAPFVVSVALVGLVCWATPSFAQTHSGAFSTLISSVSGARSGDTVDKSQDEETPTDSTAYFIQQVDPIIQSDCVVCHRAGSVAEQQGARLVFGDEPTANEQATYQFVSQEGVGADWLLNKIVGDLNHGGGSVVSRGGDSYNAFAEYLTLATGANTGGSTDATKISDVWAKTQLESRETTLRRAGLLLAGKIPTPAMIERARQSDEALRSELLALMSGEEFHDFVIVGANDRLLSRGLTSGIDFQFDFMWRFPAFASFALTLPEETPEEFETEEYRNRFFLTRGQAQDVFKVSVVQEPLELIAHIVETGKSYKEVLTADYTMVTPISALAYRADTAFEGSIIDDQGFFDLETLGNFKPGKNRGHIPHDQDSYFDEETGEIRFSAYQDWPHAGVLSTPAWLGRFPSTDTNRNRARARWTYFHFLGVDIEKSAPRSTDAAALADTNNPTMNNPACTVCHERMDPVAGAYQSFGDQGHYLDQWGGMDSLPESYKHPEQPVDDVHDLLRDPALQDEENQYYKRTLAASVDGEGGVLTVSDISPRGCIRDEEDDNNWWCASVGVKHVTIYKNGAVRKRLWAHEFEASEGFSVDQWVDEQTGESHPRGQLEGSWTDAVYFAHPNAWMAFEFDLSPGEYDIEVALVSRMDQGHPDPSVTVGLAWSQGLGARADYQVGDTWYRDMRTPGFEGKEAIGNWDSIQWLGQEIANDKRFAKATVSFWWPAIYGDDPLARPEDSSLPTYTSDLAAYNAQQAAMDQLAAGFEASGYRAKHLFADMILHPWYRTSAVSDGELSAAHEAVLATVGSGRLLTPEELDRKNRAVLGRTWGERADRGGDALDYLNNSNLSSGWWGSYGTFYGGIDSATVTSRNRSMTPLMSNVTKKMAVDLACQVVVADFAKPQEERTVFKYVSRTAVSDLLLDETFSLQGQVPVTDQWRGEWLNHPPVSMTTTLAGGLASLRITDVTRGSYASTDGEHSNADLIIQQVVIRSQDTNQSLVIDGTDLLSMSEVSIDTYHDDQGNERPRGDVDSDAGGLWLHENAWVEIMLDLPAGNYEVELTLATSLLENNVNDAMLVNVNALALDNAKETEVAQQLRRQMTSLLHSATAREPTEQQVELMIELLNTHAEEALTWGDRFFDGEGGCDTWAIWPNEQISDAEWWLKYGDRTGMMRAWTMVISGLLTSYPYLHD